MFDEEEEEEEAAAFEMTEEDFKVFVGLTSAFLVGTVSGGFVLTS